MKKFNYKSILKKILFTILALIHIFIWVFILTAFSWGENYAKINLYVIIPSIYILHILPFHILETLKTFIYRKNVIKKKTTMIDKILIIPYFFKLGKSKMERYTTFNPISPQGMLIFGLITSAYKVYPIKFTKNYFKSMLLIDIDDNS